MIETQKNTRSFMAKVPMSYSSSTHSVDGRWLMWSDTQFITMIDLFHKQTRALHFDFSSATIRGSALKVDESKLRIKDLFALDSTTALLLFRMDSSRYLGIGEIDFIRSTMIIKQTVELLSYSESSWARWFPLSYPPDLYKGVIYGLAHSYGIIRYLMVQMQNDDQLLVSEIDLPKEIRPIGCFDGFLYGIFYDHMRTTPKLPKQIDLVKYSISTGERTQEPTINWEMIEFTNDKYHSYMDIWMCLVERTLFVKQYSKKEKMYKIVTLDLDTLKWDRLKIKLGNSADWFFSDGKRALIVCTRIYRNMQFINRFLFNQPDKLADLAWLQLKKIFDSKPSSYKFILSQLPANFKQKCPFRNP